ncbi:unnamed protein product, partial [Acidithrix sp. C25]
VMVYRRATGHWGSRWGLLVGLGDGLSSLYRRVTGHWGSRWGLLVGLGNLRCRQYSLDL